jgi:hypothetical protein
MQSADARVMSVREAVIVYSAFPPADRRVLNLLSEQPVFGKHLLTWIEMEQLVECITHEYPYDSGAPLGEGSTEKRPGNDPGLFVRFTGSWAS